MKLYVTFNNSRLTVSRDHQPIWHTELHGRDPYTLLEEVRELLKTQETRKALNSYIPKIVQLKVGA